MTTRVFQISFVISLFLTSNLSLAKGLHVVGKTSEKSEPKKEVTAAEGKEQPKETTPGAGSSEKKGTLTITREGSEKTQVHTVQKPLGKPLSESDRTKLNKLSAPTTGIKDVPSKLKQQATLQLNSVGTTAKPKK